MPGVRFPCRPLPQLAAKEHTMRVTIPLIAVLAILIGVGGAAVLPDKPADETPDAAQPVATGDVYHADPDPDYVPTTVVDVAFAPYLQPYLPSAYHAAWGGFQELTALPVPSQVGPLGIRRGAATGHRGRDGAAAARRGRVGVGSRPAPQRQVARDGGSVDWSGCPRGGRSGRLAARERRATAVPSRTRVRRWRRSRVAAGHAALARLPPGSPGW